MGRVGVPRYGVAFFFTIIAGSYLGRVHWSADWLTFFVPHFFGIAVILTLFFSWRRRWLWAGLALAVFLLQGWRLAPYTSFFSEKPLAQTASTIRLYSQNIYYANARPAALLAEIKAHDPDLVFLMEYNNDLRAVIESELQELYPYYEIWPSRMTMGIALFSRLPMTAEAVREGERRTIPVMQAVIGHEGETISFVGGHPWPPLPQWGGIHEEHINQIASAVGQMEAPMIVAGDFNASPWSYHLARIEGMADLRSAAYGNGARGTWDLPVVPMKLLFDQVLVSPDLAVTNFVLGEGGGSDHLPIIVDVQVERP